MTDKKNEKRKSEVWKAQTGGWKDFCKQLLKDKKWSEQQKLIEELEETVIRLHAYLRRLDNENKRFSVIKGKIEKKGPSIFTQKQKIETSLWGEERYFHGKMMAYMFVLDQLGHKDLPKIIQRLRGMKQISEAKIIETK